MKNIITVIFSLTICACASTEPAENTLFEQMISELSDIEFKKQGVSPEGRPYMANICKGFILSKDMVKDFFAQAEYVNESEATERFKALPCYSVGSVEINAEKYSWVIRAGGIGEFYNENNKFFKICGEQCCKKNPVLC